MKPKQRLVKELKNFLGRDLDEKELHDLPSKWQKRGDLIIFPANAFQHPSWGQYGITLVSNLVS